MNTLVSIILPAYNGRSTIRGALDSVLRQTYQCWEAIVVDDGSTDGTAEAVADWARGEPRCKLIRHKRTRGAQAARNSGIRAAEGHWIAFLDSDDEWLPYSLEELLQVAQAKGVHVVCSEGLTKRGDNGKLEPCGIRQLQGWVYSDVLRANGPMLQGVVVTKKAVEQIGYFDERIVSYQEWDTVICLAKQFAFGYLSRPTFVYNRCSVDGISGNPHLVALGYEQVFRKHWKPMLRHCGLFAIAFHARGVAQRCKRVNSVKAFRYWLLATLLCPVRPRAIRRRIQQYFASRLGYGHR